MAIKTYNPILTVAHQSNDAPSLLTSGDSDLTLLETITNIAKTLRVVKYRGSATFQISQNGDLHWTCQVSFTDANPDGVWNNINHHAPV